MCVVKSLELLSKWRIAKTKHRDDKSQDPVTSPRFRRQSVQSELKTLGKDVPKIESPDLTDKRGKLMDSLDAKLSELEKRTSALTEVYDNLLQRTEELESKARECELEHNREKTSFDVVEILMQKDGRSKATFQHVSLFFFVLLKKLQRKGIHITSTTELWSRLGDEVVKRAFENTVTNLGFSDEEKQCLNLVLDVLHEKDLITYVNNVRVDTNNLATKLHDLSHEFAVDNPEVDDESEAMGATDGYISSGSQTDAMCPQCRDDVACCCDCKSVPQPSSDMGDFDPACGDSIGVDSLLLYLKIQQEMDPLVKSALSRAVAIAHSSLVKTNITPIADNTDMSLHVEPPCSETLDVHDVDHVEEIIENIAEGISAITLPQTPINTKLNLRSGSEMEDNRPEGCGAPYFFDFITSTPRVTNHNEPDENCSNNAIMADPLIQNLNWKFDDVSSLDSGHCDSSTLSFDCNSDEESELSYSVSVEFNDKPDSLPFDTCPSERTLARLETLIASHSSCAPENAQNKFEDFRTFFRDRVKQQTEELVRRERDMLKSKISKPKKNVTTENESNHRSVFSEIIQNQETSDFCEITQIKNVSTSTSDFSDVPENKACFDSKKFTQNRATPIFEIFEVDGLSDYEEIPDSEYISYGSQHQFDVEPSSYPNGNKDGRSLSLHEELSGLGYFRSNSCRTSCVDSDVNSDHDQACGVTSTLNVESESKGVRKEQANFFTTSSSSNPFGYDFDMDYYMLWPGQEMEVELKDLSSETQLEDQVEEAIELSYDMGFDMSGYSFSDSWIAETIYPWNRVDYDTWLIV